MSTPVTGIGVDLGELGLPVADSFAPVAGEPKVETTHPGALVPGSPLAQVVYQVWSGREVVVVPSPPGAGKSTLVAGLVEALVPRSGLKVGVVCPTRFGAISLANRLGQSLGKGKVGLWSRLSEEEERFIRPEVVTGPGQLVWITTVASAAMAGGRQADVLVVDEAWQSKFTDVAAAAEKSQQIVLVGDPGQIGPVERVDTSLWDDSRRAPHRPAPEVLLTDGDPFVVTLPSTYRLGQQTVDAIAPLYDFPFDSKRPERYVRVHGQRLAELSPWKLGFGNEFDRDALVRVADYALDVLANGEYVEVDEDGTEHVRALTGQDVAIGCTRTAQVATISARMQQGGPVPPSDSQAVMVGTADSLQGGQWPVFIAVDPLVGAPSLNDFRVSRGRLCVLVSRHMAHLTFVHDGKWRDLLAEAAQDSDDAARGLAVRERIVAHGA